MERGFNRTEPSVDDKQKARAVEGETVEGPDKQDLANLSN